jgi:hypothetical protein
VGEVASAAPSDDDPSDFQVIEMPLGDEVADSQMIA